MREILFRGKRIDNGEWEEGFVFDDGLIDSEKMFIGSIVIENNEITGRCFCEVDPSTVGRYTGLKDKNGKRIFEGDIVEHHAQGNIIVNRGVVNWDVKNARWAHQLTTMNPDFTFFKPDAYEIIGNIHDSPEFMEVR